MLGQRRRRWPNIEPTMAQSLVFAGIPLSRQNTPWWRVHARHDDGSPENTSRITDVPDKCWLNVGPAARTPVWRFGDAFG